MLSSVIEEPGCVSGGDFGFVLRKISAGTVGTGCDCYAVALKRCALVKTDAGTLLTVVARDCDGAPLNSFEKSTLYIYIDR